VGKPERKTAVARLIHRWVDNIKMDLRRIRRDGTNWIDLAKDRDQRRALVNTVMKLWVPENVGKFLNSCTTGGFSCCFLCSRKSVVK
jgi:hypothetical protein